MRLQVAFKWRGWGVGMVRGWIQRFLERTPAHDPVACAQTLAVDQEKQRINRDDLAQRLSRLENKLDRLADDTTFLKRRLSTYIGDGMALTYLADETPIFVNSTDRVGPMNLINGGVFEADNLDVLFSYLKPHALCLDIGANLGFFTVNLAKRLRAPGRVLAFEPQAMLCRLINRTTFLNGVRDLVTIHDHGLSDRNGDAEFYVPHDHLGAAHVVDAQDAPANANTVKCNLRRLDDVLAPGTVVDLVKIDVERHELYVLRGMRRILIDSPDVVILFEKIDINDGYELRIETFLADLGFELFTIMPDAELRSVKGAALVAWSGYVLAARPPVVGALRRARFTIYPAQLRGANLDAHAKRLTVEATDGQLLFHGPYWFVRRGRWKLRVLGQLTGAMTLVVSENFGHRVADFDFDHTLGECEFVTDHDLTNFECVGHARGSKTVLDLACIEIERID